MLFRSEVKAQHLPAALSRCFVGSVLGVLRRGQICACGPPSVAVLRIGAYESVGQGPVEHFGTGNELRLRISPFSSGCLCSVDRADKPRTDVESA
eukprot:9468333-Pyramimonas_sp.AAC.2